MEEIDIHAKLAQIETAPHFSMIFDGDTEKAEMIAEHLMWLHSIRRERPLVSRPYKVGIYIRYFNQTRYNNYLDFHNFLRIKANAYNSMYLLYETSCAAFSSASVSL